MTNPAQRNVTANVTEADLTLANSTPLHCPQAVILEQLAHDRLVRELELEAEVKRLRQGLWDCAKVAGVDTDGDETPDHLAYPDIVKWALNAVSELRDDYNAALDEIPMLPDA